MIESTRDHPERSTVVLVHPAATGLAHRLRGSTIEVSSVLDAVGMVARAPTTDPVALVLIPRRVIELFDDAATAIKRIDPGVRVLMVSSEPGASAEADWQLDGVVDAHADDSKLREVLGDETLAPTAAPPSADTSANLAPDRRGVVPTDPPAPPSYPTNPVDPFGAGHHASPASIVDPEERSRLLGAHDGTEDQDASRGTSRLRPPSAGTSDAPRTSDGTFPERPTAPDRPDRLDRPDRPDRPASPAPPASNAPVLDEAPEPISFAEAVRARESAIELEQPREALGDIDLVDSVLEDDRELVPTAVQLIREQTGWLDLEYMPNDGRMAGPDDRPAIDVAENGHVFGRLRSRAAESHELSLWAGWLARWLELGRRYETFREQSQRDPLTGAWNRRALLSFLDRSIVAARAARRPVTVMLIDVDDFKHFNDRFGHEAGDIILRETVRLLSSVIRSCDRVCRIGGDEFCVVFADFDEPRAAGSTMPDDVAFMVKRFQMEVDQMRFPRLGIDAPGHLSISAGLATFPWDAGDGLGLIRVADQRALESKRAGKNRITVGSHNGSRRDADGPADSADPGDLRGRRGPLDPDRQPAPRPDGA
ncbi:MAG: diguanylate cyclase [Phycisphaerales bacterium]